MTDNTNETMNGLAEAVADLDIGTVTQTAYMFDVTSVDELSTDEKATLAINIFKHMGLVMDARAYTELPMALKDCFVAVELDIYGQPVVKDEETVN